MNSQKFETNSFCVGGKHRSGTKNVTGGIAFNKKTGKEIKFLVGKCVISDRKKSMIVSDNTIRAESFSDFFKKLGKKGLNVSKKWQKGIKKSWASLRFNSKNSHSSSFSKFQTGSINITRSDSVLQHRKGSLPRQICLNYTI